MRRRLSFAVLLVGWFVAAIAWSAPIRFGISEFAERSVNEPIIPATVALLEKTFGKDNVSAVTYSVANLQKVAKAGEVDVILSSAGTYRRLSLEGAGVHSLASVASARVPDPNYADGSVFFTRKDREDIRTIEVSTLSTWFLREIPNKKRPPRRSFLSRRSRWATAESSRASTASNRSHRQHRP